MSSVSASVNVAASVASDSSTAPVAPTITVANIVSETESIEDPDAGSSSEFKCEQCDDTNISEIGLAQHFMMRHRISQVDGLIDSEEETDKENSEDKDFVTLELNTLGRIIGPKLLPNTLPP